jgi:CRP/FNR family transcriptional regulator, cyclic AMP receptor protein
MTPGTGDSDVMATSAEHVHLLQVCPGLGAGLTRRELTEARRLVVAPSVTVPAGQWETGELARMVGTCPLGCIVTDGVIAHDLMLGGRPATYLIGPGDVLAPTVQATRYLAPTRLFTVTDLARLAILDESFYAVARTWPSIAGALLVQVEAQMERIAVQQLISQLPRADQRIVALLWHLADRWGRAEQDGVVVPLTVGHEALSRLVGGRRPTVSAALGRLADRGLVVRLANDTWLLSPASRALLDHAAAAPGPTPSVRLLGRRRHAERASAGSG